MLLSILLPSWNMEYHYLLAFSSKLLQRVVSQIPKGTLSLIEEGLIHKLSILDRYGFHFYPVWSRIKPKAYQFMPILIWLNSFKKFGGLLAVAHSILSFRISAIFVWIGMDWLLALGLFPANGMIADISPPRQNLDLSEIWSSIDPYPSVRRSLPSLTAKVPPNSTAFVCFVSTPPILNLQFSNSFFDFAEGFFIYP